MLPLLLLFLAFIVTVSAFISWLDDRPWLRRKRIKTRVGLGMSIIVLWTLFVFAANHQEKQIEKLRHQEMAKVCAPFGGAADQESYRTGKISTKVFVCNEGPRVIHKIGE